MKKRLFAVLAITALLLLCSSVKAVAEESVVSLTGSSSISDYKNIDFDAIIRTIDFSTLTTEQLRLLEEFLEAKSTGVLPSSYSSWDEYKNALLSNPDVIKLLKSYYASQSAYKRAQNALASMPIAVLSAGYLNQLNSYDQAFYNMDMKMMLPYKDRIAHRYANKTAVVGTNAPQAVSIAKMYSKDSLQSKERGLWFRPYASIGSINFKNGPLVDTKMYGAFIGGDSSLIRLKNSDFQYSIYAGYNGSYQKYGENSIVSNGGTLGVTGAWYGERAFAALTINGGATDAKISTHYMNKDYPLFSAGVAGKTGYNFEFAEGKFIIQPSYLMSYSFVTPFDKGKVYGMDVESKPLNVLNISPGIKFIGNLEHGWQPYAEARMVWNLLGKTDYSTAKVDVPSLSIKPYAQYGVGIQKLWGERSTGYLEFMMRSGGRNDVIFLFGYKCAIDGLIY